ncbi:T9SS type A sorting domain-containing protein [Bizionia argentinensis JUB59]|uniref:T9SS type A sorting domain-containing protein n=1 Tax=Bizionia argentinensis JUB59 TaxID=1046627 RepID=G2EHF5_9FLAO|nr:T9SS type A sorting domain-containing protein [Bizionia argentinensis]EGV42098.1 T9SS type A sorting domain-containing protein [Bizionia argentinensis JUB59]
MIKKLLFTVALITTYQFASAQFALGDIAFSAYNSDSTIKDDAFTFVVLRDVVVGEQIVFDENGWFFQLGGLRTGEGVLTFTFGNAYAAGTQIIISRIPFEAVDQNGDSAGAVTGTGLGLATGGDSIFAYNVGAVLTTTDDSGFIAAINMTGEWSTSGSLLGNTTTTEKPDIFTEGINAVSIESEIDNARISAASCGSFTDVASLRTLLNTAVNWERDDEFPYMQYPVLCDILATLNVANHAFLENQITLAPNPSKGLITIKSSGVVFDQVTVKDINGRTISTQNFNGTTTITSLDLSSLLSSGMYFMTITSSSNSIIKKIIIQ